MKKILIILLSLLTLAMTGCTKTNANNINNNTKNQATLNEIAIPSDLEIVSGWTSKVENGYIYIYILMGA